MKIIYMLLFLLLILLTQNGCRGQYEENISGGCVYVHQGFLSRMIGCPTESIEPTICDYAYDDSFIIALQAIGFVTDENDDYKKASTVCYWIRSNSNNKLYGPFTVEEFEIKRKELKVPAKLKLDTISIYGYKYKLKNN